MKLWKTFKIGSGHKTTAEHKTTQDKQNSSCSNSETYELEDMIHQSRSESPDSGLPGERCARRVIVHLDKRNGATLGILLASRSEPGLLPTISGFKKESSCPEADRLAPGDRICSINGIATSRLTNDEVLSLLENVEERASLEVEYYVPNYDSQNSLCITTKVTQVAVEKAADGSLGITLRPANECPRKGGQTGCRNGIFISGGPLLVTHIRPSGPAHATARIKPGDRLLKVDNIPLSNKSLSEAYQILQTCPPVTNLTIEYDVSIMDSVKFATGPLLIEIERANNESIGLVLTNKPYTDDYFSNTPTYLQASPESAIYVESIIPASIADRCGALHPGDQILVVDDLVVENSNYTPEEIMGYMESCSNKRYTQLQILPVHMYLKNLRMKMQSESPISGISTLNARKGYKRNRQLRQSSLPKSFEMDSEYVQNNFVTGVGICRTEVLSVKLEIPPGQDSGISVCEDRDLLLISHITHQSPAYRSGCLQLGDRIVSINNEQNLTSSSANNILQKRNESMTTEYLNIKSEFSMADSVEASSGIFNVKLAKSEAGLGITITGNKQKTPNKDDPVTISHIKVGSVAYRSGTLAVGDQLIAIDTHPLHDLSLDAAFHILQNFPNDIITLTIRKTDKEWDSNQKFSNYNYIEPSSPSINSSVKSDCNYIFKPQPKPQWEERIQNNGSNSNKYEICTENMFEIDLTKSEEGPLGLTVAGSEDATQPIIVSGLIKGGVAEQSGVLKIGDHILSINGQSVHNKPLSQAISLLQMTTNHITLTILRKTTNCTINKAKITVPVQIEKTPNNNNNRDSNTFTTNSQSSPGLLSIDSAVESWDSQPTIYKTTLEVTQQNNGSNDAGNNSCAFNENNTVENRMSYLPTDENKLLASSYRFHPNADKNDLPLPNYSFTNTLRTFKNENMTNDNHNNKKQDLNNSQFRNNNQMLEEYFDELNFGIENHNQNQEYPSQMKPITFKTSSDNNSDKNSNGSKVSNGKQSIYPRQYEDYKNYNQLETYLLPSTSYQLSTNNPYDCDIPGFYSIETSSNQGTIHHVTLYKDVIYDDYGFSLSDGLYERGVYINRIRKGGPADIVGLLKPFDRILQVNGTRTVDFDCCLTVPLIASAGDRIELVIQRLKDSTSWNEDTNLNLQDVNNVITKTI